LDFPAPSQSATLPCFRLGRLGTGDSLTRQTYSHYAQVRGEIATRDFGGPTLFDPLWRFCHHGTMCRIAARRIWQRAAVPDEPPDQGGSDTRTPMSVSDRMMIRCARSRAIAARHRQGLPSSPSTPALRTRRPPRRVHLGRKPSYKPASLICWLRIQTSP
jgi:hypothetical protein